MDPISASIVASLTAGVVSGLTKTSEQALKDGYEAIKTLLRKKFGGRSDVVKAVNSLEQKPASAARQAVLQEEIKEADAHNDPDLIQAAAKLLEVLKEQPEARSKIQQIVRGDNNIVSGRDINITDSHID